MIEKIAPIVLFVYNRPYHAAITIEALKKNYLASQSDLIIYSDGPRSEADLDNIRLVRDYIRKVEGFKSVSVIEREKNVGLGKSIIEGVTCVINEYGKIIVLEDDIRTSQYFLMYMNDALEKYSNEEMVMSVSGYTPPMNKDNILEETFFMSWPDCWGWGTWKRSWDKFERDPENLIKNSSKEFINKVNIDGAAPSMWDQVIDNYQGRRHTWAIFFHTVICRYNGLTLYSKTSLTSNEGMDGSGDDTGTTVLYDVAELKNDKVSYYPDSIKKNDDAETALKEFYKKVGKKQLLIFRIINVLKKEGAAGVRKRIRIYFKR